MNLAEFKKEINSFYLKNKRAMPWRETNDPYSIFISEVMLQQTQVSRVMQKYPEFLNKFPDFSHLASASLEDVLQMWSGMGYNRRALYLKKSAEIVTQKYHGELPQNPDILDELPGVGYATSRSIAAFAFQFPSIFIETNIRRVFIHFFFLNKVQVDDKEIMPLIEQTLDKKNPREWYYALMDYGTMLGKKRENPNKKSRHYVVQSQFEGSGRQIRGKILKELIHHKALPKNFFFAEGSDTKKIENSLNALQKEGFIMEEKGVYRVKKSDD